MAGRGLTSAIAVTVLCAFLALRPAAGLHCSYLEVMLCRAVGVGERGEWERTARVLVLWVGELGRSVHAFHEALGEHLAVLSCGALGYTESGLQSS